MNLKLILCLALVLSGGLWIAFRSSPHSTVIHLTPAGKWTKKLKAPWTATQVILYRNSGDVVQLGAKKAIYSVWSKTNSAGESKSIDFSMTAFIDPATSNVWIGGGMGEGYTNFFIETDSEILQADAELNDGTFDCYESLVKKSQPDETLDSVIACFEKLDGNTLPFCQTQWETQFLDSFPQGFFDSGENMGNQTTPIDRIKVTKRYLQLNFYSRQYKTKASVWLNLKTLKVSRIVQHE